MCVGDECVRVVVAAEEHETDYEYEGSDNEEENADDGVPRCARSQQLVKDFLRHLLGV